MTIMKSDGDDGSASQKADKTQESKVGENATSKSEANVFSDTNIGKPSEISEDEASEAANIRKSFVIDPIEKASFIDAIVNNKRYTRDYSLFGGRIKFTVRSLTLDEVNALSAWIATKGTEDSAGLLAGRYRKYLMAAQIERINGVEMPPLEQPLFATLDKDGKTVNDPGWLNRSAYWDGISFGQFNAMMECIRDFDMRYTVLCSKAEDANFWNPDTP